MCLVFTNGELCVELLSVIYRDGYALCERNGAGQRCVVADEREIDDISTVPEDESLRPNDR